VLIRRHVERVARLMRTYGELRPGFLDQDAASFTGPADKGKSRPKYPVAHERRGRSYKLSFQQDPATGDLRPYE
jgi:hypothetical protein